MYAQMYAYQNKEEKSWAWWPITVVPVTLEVEAGFSLETRSSGPAWATQ